MGAKAAVIAACVVLFQVVTAWAGDAALAKPKANEARSVSPAERLVRDALAAGLSGDNPRRNMLLAEALKQDPNCRPARWQSGFVEFAGRWLTPAQIAALSAADTNLAEYRRRRAEATAAQVFARQEQLATASASNVSPTASQYAVSESRFRSSGLSPAGLAAHAELARWCRSKNLADEERAHWMQVLTNDPDNREAQERLHMRWSMGGLLTNSQIDAAKQHSALEEKQLKQWTPVVLRWQRAIEHGSPSERAQALSEMSSTNDPAVIPALERFGFTEAARQSAKTDAVSPFQRQTIALLGRLAQQRATYSLAVIAVLSPQAEIRDAAIGELRRRPLHDFVPLLLAQLANPIEFSFAGNYDAASGLAYYRTVAQQEGPDSIRQIEQSATVAGTTPTTVVISGLIASQFTHRPPTISLVRSRTPDLGPIPAAVTESERFAARVERQNAHIQLLNSRINSVLQQVTSNSAATASQLPEDDSNVIPDEAKAKPTISMADYWWSWWADYNESYQAYDKPLESVHQNVAKFTSDKMFFLSCFPAGTPVITQLGPTPIEKIQIGDRVLAQDQDTGELCFKPVLGTTIRPPADMLDVTTTAGEIRLTKGHPFWIVGKGWRMAKELKPGDRLHTLHGSNTVEAVKPANAAAAYNLVVADFGTYFVGPAAILVHDNSPRLPTRAGVPGLAKAP